MAVLLDLPDETLLQIWDSLALLPESIPAAAVTCKRFHSIGSKVLARHRALVKEWQHLDFDPPSLNDMDEWQASDKKSPADVLLALSRNPLAGLYARSFRYGDPYVSVFQQQADHPIKVHGTYQELVASTQRLFHWVIPGIQKGARTPAHHAMSWLWFPLNDEDEHARTTQEDQEPAVALTIFTMCPNIRTLHLEYTNCYADLLRCYSKSNAFYYTDKSLRGSGVTRKVHTVVIHRDEGLSPEAFNTAQCFAEWPTVQHIRVSRLPAPPA